MEHSFSGTPEQKSAASVVYFDRPSQIDFLPKQLLNDFPQLNAIAIKNCYTFKTVKEDLFTKDFGAIQYLDLAENKIETIEANAFQHLPKLKWISLWYNELSSLPHQIFKNNPELVFIWIGGNKINSITSDFFKNLYKLQFVGFGGNNQCSNKRYGCNSGSCSIAQSVLDSGFTKCFNNCLNDVVCASKSGKLDKLSPEQIEKNLNLIVSSGHAAALIEKGYSNLLVQKGYGDLVAGKDPKPEVPQRKIENPKNETQECEAKKFEEISQNLKTLKEDVKVQQETIETLRNNLTLLVQSNAECKEDSKAIKSELEPLKQELADLKTKMEKIKDCSDDLGQFDLDVRRQF
jgi:Leucine-rich repeat (LRR) protein